MDKLLSKAIKLSKTERFKKELTKTYFIEKRRAENALCIRFRIMRCVLATLTLFLFLGLFITSEIPDSALYQDANYKVSLGILVTFVMVSAVVEVFISLLRLAIRRTIPKKAFAFAIKTVALRTGELAQEARFVSKCLKA